MSKRDLQTLGQALERLDIYTKHGFYYIKQTSGAKVNISKHLYKYIKALTEHTNKLFISHSLDYSVPLLKQYSVEPHPVPAKTNCVAIAIHHWLDKPYSQVHNYIIAIYGTNGVPADAIDSVIRHFDPHAYKVESPSGNLHNDFMWFKTSPSNGHAVNAYWNAGGTIVYQDYQNNISGTIDLNDVSAIWSK